MREQATVFCGKWERDSQFRKLSIWAKALYSYLSVSEAGSVVGLFVLRREEMREALGVRRQRLDATLRELAKANLVHYDDAFRLVYMVGYMQQNAAHAKGEKLIWQIASGVKAVAMFKESQLHCMWRKEMELAENSNMALCWALATKLGPNPNPKEDITDTEKPAKERGSRPEQPKAGAAWKKPVSSQPVVTSVKIPTVEETQSWFEELRARRERVEQARSGSPSRIPFIQPGQPLVSVVSPTSSTAVGWR